MDWVAWHDRYADPDSPLSRRLRAVQGHITEWLDTRTDPANRVVSVCAGQGHDLLGVLEGRSDADRVRARLIEFDETNVEAARSRDTAGDVEVWQADAGDFASYRDAVPADLVLLVGVLGNITDEDVRATIAALPHLCAAGATVIWTRTRAEPDLTPAIRNWFADNGFEELAFDAPDDVLWSVGVHRFAGAPRPLPESGRLFRFVPART